MLSLEAHVDGATTNLPQQRKSQDFPHKALIFHSYPHLMLFTAEYGPKIESCLRSLLEALAEVVDTFKSALYFLLIRVCHSYQPLLLNMYSSPVLYIIVGKSAFYCGESSDW